MRSDRFCSTRAAKDFLSFSRLLLLPAARSSATVAVTCSGLSAGSGKSRGNVCVQGISGVSLMFDESLFDVKHTDEEDGAVGRFGTSATSRTNTAGFFPRGTFHSLLFRIATTHLSMQENGAEIQF